MTNPFSQAKAIVAKLVRAGHIAYFAGGWVRDFVMQHPSEDIDIATSATTAQIMDLFPHTNLVGIAFGVVLVRMEGHQFEVASFRKDLNYIDGRHPTGIELATPEEDALRRDFTINGMFYDPLEENIHDFVHGREDIQMGLIRAIGDPHKRFFEDRLRMLRAFRFSARFSFTIELETQEAIRENADKLFPAVAMERVLQEFNKMAAYPRFDQAIVEMHRLNLLDIIFPEIAGIHIKDLRHKVKYFSWYPCDCPPVLYLMECLTALPFAIRMEIGKRLKVSNKDCKLLEYMENLEKTLKQEMETSVVDLPAWTTLFASPDWEICLKILSARYADEEKDEFFEKYAQRFAELEPHILRLRNGNRLVTAAILQEQGITAGKKMGGLLKEAERIAITENLHDADSVLAILKRNPLWNDRP